MELLDRLEFLSKLKFSNEEKKDFLKDFENIVSMVDEIKTIEIVDQIKEEKQIMLQDLREDVLLPSLEQTSVLQNAPKQKDGCYNTPLVVE